ncbi:hypothetical protein [Aromatoleum evansii]|uniref:hypothetical protein n=1 Tax=Aromatoleum evansii TaxID=59406 RepID=UPI001FE6F8A3|nr:hypothetical protein [Aromatoleum evansii]
MYPVLPFAIGAMVGAAAVRLLKTVNLRGGLDKAQEKLRDATITSLDAIEHSSAGLKAKLAAAPEPAEAAPAEAPPTRKAAPRRRSSPAAGAAKPAAPAKPAAKAAKSADAAPARPRTRKKAAAPVPPGDTGDSA